MISNAKHRKATAVDELIEFLEGYLATPGNLSVAELASKAGISRIYLYKIKRRESEPSFTVAMNLAKAMGASISEICPENSVS